MSASVLIAFVALAAQIGNDALTSLSNDRATDPMNFVNVLTEAGIPAGLEIRESDVRRVGLQQRRSGNAPPKPVVPVEQLIAVFNRDQREYAAALDNGVVVIRPQSGRSDYFQSKPFSAPIAGVGLMRVSEKVFAPLDPRLDQPGGRPGSFLGQPGVEVDYGDQIRLAVDTANTLTVLNVLIEIAKQAPGHSWVVATAGTPSRIVRFGFNHGFGKTTWMTVQTAR